MNYRKSVGASNATTTATSPEDATVRSFLQSIIICFKYLTIRKEKILQENATELKAYDSKVYRASLEMARAIETELRRLGVPFFCIDQALISNGDNERSAPETTSGVAVEGGKKVTKISKDELEALKRRVLDLLVDLCS